MSHRATLVSKSVRKGRRQSQDSERERERSREEWGVGSESIEEEEVVGVSLSQAGLVYIHKSQAEESTEYIQYRGAAEVYGKQIYCKRKLFYGSHEKETGVA